MMTTEYSTKASISNMVLLRLCLVFLALTAAVVQSAPHFVVTDIVLVTADTSEAAIEACDKTYQAAAVGVDWGMVNGSAVAHLCQRRQYVEDVKPSQRVLQKIGVYGATECPPNMELFYRPKHFRVVCLTWESASIALLSGNYISDLWVSTQRNYNNDDIGWTSLHTSAFTPASGFVERFRQKLWTPAYHGTFISYKRPVLPIREVRVLEQTNSKDSTSACSAVLGSQWQDTSDSYPIEVGDSTRALCVRRSNKTSEPALLATRVTTYVESCSGQYNQTELLGNGVYLCLLYGEQTADAIVHMYLESSIRSDSAAFVLPGRLWLEMKSSMTYSETLRQAPHVYTARATARSYEAPEPLDRPPLVAKQAANGKLTFKILQLADLHYTGDPTTKCKDAPNEIGSDACSEAVMTKYVNELLDFEKPDFVAFSGDNVETFSSSLRQAAMDAATAGVEARGIPYAMIFGNHDDENGFPRWSLMEMATKKPHSYSQSGRMEVDGVGNYELNVKAPSTGAWGAADSDVFRMYFLDSGSFTYHSNLRDEDTKYDWIRPSQVEYYRQMSAAHNSTVPAVMFFHIPLPEYAMDVSSQRTGEHREGVHSSKVHSNLFSTLVELDEVKATFAGHDHVNEYCYKRESVQLCYGGGAGFGVAYGMKEVQRRARVIEWSVDGDNKREIRTWKRVFGRLDERVDDQVLYEG
ncbi:hypothetical protein Poli38472_011790 [Pythium oligandrum]|uniref:Calcineurin-like phosphoesterase domain-containing protein n=1 Tax=Pythium oligandrum TaxID=41045 RepID=A0A8K1FG04_PYTOL|nr:hypothetical protein Poli38472_011790 [Pythium oligandrum]|eukprot:TMW58202.1 hypothetical protein Poli38472_011790 [Pythium oligandrum]